MAFSDYNVIRLFLLRLTVFLPIISNFHLAMLFCFIFFVTQKIRPQSRVMSRDLIFQTITTIKKHFEQILWIAALLFLYFMDVSTKANSFCLFRLIGLESCPGCGIGHSIHYVMHLQFRQSFYEHILGIPSTIGIFYIILKPLFSHKAQINLSWSHNKFL
jgi:hypothetical protein